MKHNISPNKFRWVYLVGFFIIGFLPILTLPPWFYSNDWGKTIVFRSILSILIFLFIYQWLFKKHQLSLVDIKKNVIFWALAALFFTFLLATIFSVDYYFSVWGSPARSGGFINFTFYIILAMLSFFVLKDKDWKKVWDFSIFVGLLVSGLALIQFYSLLSGVFTPQARPSSTLGNPDFVAVYLLFLLILTVCFFIREKMLIKKWWYFFVSLVFFYTIIIIGSRAAYFGMLLGGLYFLFLYPKKLFKTKISAVIILTLALSFVYYVNTAGSLPEFLGKSRIFQAIAPRLSIQSVAAEGRFSAWPVVVRAIASKPILGWGPENMQVGFDKYFNPNTDKLTVNWWDRAHNILLDIAVQAGILGLISYLFLFACLFQTLRLTKIQTAQTSDQIMIHGVQTTLIAYLAANIFSFDNFSTYLIFFLIVGYSLHLSHLLTTDPALMTTQKNAENASKNQRGNQLAFSGQNILRHITKRRKIVLGMFLILLGWFLWQYNVKPFSINAEINRAENLVNEQKCDQAFTTMNSILTQHSYLDAYVRIQYVEFIKTCAVFYPENELSYAKKGVELMKEISKIQPLYTRLWIFLGSFTTLIANQEQNLTTKENLIQEANGYFEKALMLASKHQEIWVEKAKTDMVANEYQKMRGDSEQCIKLNQDLGDCYWYLGLAQLYVNDVDRAKDSMQTAQNKKYATESSISLNQLVGAYVAIKNYQELELVYEKLITMMPDNPQYHASLAATYKELGKYEKAREQAMIFLKLEPSNKDEVDAFLKTLP